jgi:hypothetical protein
VSIRTDEALCYAWRNGTCPDQEQSTQRPNESVGSPSSPRTRCFYLARLLLFYNILNILSRIGSEPELKSQAHTHSRFIKLHRNSIQLFIEISASPVTSVIQYCKLRNITSVQPSTTSTPCASAISSNAEFSVPGLKIMRLGFRLKI